MIGIIKIDVSFMELDPKLLGSMLCNLPSDSVIKEITSHKINDSRPYLGIAIESDFFTSEGEIVAKFQRDHSQPEDRSFPVVHDHFAGFDFSEVTK